MTGIAEISAAYGAVKHVKDILVGARNLQDTTKINAIVFEAQEHLLTMQESLFNAQQTVAEIAQEKTQLEAKITELEDWKDKEQLYELITLKGGIHVYALKEGLAKGKQPARTHCPNCFHKKHISILQKPSHLDGILQCFDCEFRVTSRYL